MVERDLAEISNVQTAGNLHYGGIQVAERGPGDEVVSVHAGRKLIGNIREDLIPDEDVELLISREFKRIRD